MKLVTSVLGGVGLGVVVSLLTLGACGGDKSAPGGTTGGANSANVGGGGNVGGSSAGGSTGTTAGGSANAGGGTGKCPNGPTVVPADNGKMSDFAAANITGANPDGTFGVDVTGVNADVNVHWGTTGLTGGTFFYVPNLSDGITKKAADGMQAAIVNDTLNLKANIAANDYTGFGFYFGPNCGSNACNFSGISFTLSGSLGGSTVDVQVQMNEDYPLNSDNKGLCDYVAADAANNKWGYCKNPHASLATFLPTGVTTVAQTVLMPWGAFAGGNPTDPLKCGQLLGLQLQFNCGSTPCTPNVIMDELQFY